MLKLEHDAHEWVFFNLKLIRHQYSLRYPREMEEVSHPVVLLSHADLLPHLKL
jgi:hypothetical protein